MTYKPNGLEPPAVTSRSEAAYPTLNAVGRRRWYMKK